MVIGVRVEPELEQRKGDRVHGLAAVQVRPIADDPRDVQVRPLAVDPLEAHTALLTNTGMTWLQSRVQVFGGGGGGVAKCCMLAGLQRNGDQ